MKKEVEERNYYLGLFNANEPIVENAIRKYNIELRNPITLARKKNQELESSFSKARIEYYTGTLVGSILKDYLITSVADSIESLAPVIEFENSITYFTHRIPFIKNPYLDNFQKKIQKIEGIAIDRNFSTILGDCLNKHDFLQQMPIITKELVELGYIDLARVVMPEAYQIIDQKESGSTSKATQKIIKN